MMKLTWAFVNNCLSYGFVSQCHIIRSQTKDHHYISYDDPVRGASNPPDPIDAPGPKSIITVVNTAIQAIDRSGNEKWNATLFDFFEKLQPGPNTKHNDPKIV
jgi:hypothetical protein